MFFFLSSAEYGCGATFTDSDGTFTSPGYPNPYAHNSDCVWIITVATGNTVRLTFMVFDLQSDLSCQYDYVEVSVLQLASLCDYIMIISTLLLY